MLKKFFVFAALTMLWCGPALAERHFPTPSSGYHPKMVYSASVDQSWSAIISALRANKLIVKDASKDALQITTDYSSTVKDNILGGLVGYDLYRYRFIIYLELAGSQTKVTIQPALEESKVRGGFEDARTEPYTDVTDESRNTEDVAKLRDWLYEKIESTFGSQSVATN